MKKITFNSRNRFSLFVPAIAIVFLLQSCFSLCPTGGNLSKRPCNCKDDNKPVYAVNNKLASPEAKQASVQPAIAVMEQSTNNNNLATNLEDAAQLPANISDDRIVESPPAVQALQQISATNTDAEPEPESQPTAPRPSGTVSPQKTQGAKLPLGIKGVATSIIAGPCMSFKSSKEDYGNTEHKHNPGVGFQFGIGSSYIFTEKFAVNSAILFKHNNATEVLNSSSTGEPGSNPGNNRSESKYSYNYLSVPIVAQVKLSERVTATAGPEINYLLSSSVKTAGTGNNEKTSLTDNSVKLGVGVQVGIGYDFPGSPIGIQLVYDHRLSRLNEKKESSYYVPGGGGGSYEIPAWNMKSIQLSLTCSLCELMKKN